MPTHNKCNCERLARLVVELMAQEDITQKLVEYYTEVYEEDELTFNRVWEAVSYTHVTLPTILLV